MSRFAQRLRPATPKTIVIVGGWPNETNTGVPSGTMLLRIPEDVTSGTGWAWDSRGWITISGNGAIFSGYQTNLNVDVTANNVLISNCQINTPGANGFAISLRTTDGVTIQNCTIGGLRPGGGSDNADQYHLQFAVKDIYSTCTNTTIKGCQFYDTANTLSFVGSVLIEDNFIHNMGYDASDHVDSIINGGGGSGMTIRHNTIFNELNQTAGIALYQDFGTPVNVTIDNNLLGGGGYTIYAGGGASAGHDVKITNNHFTTRFYTNSGNFGPYTAFQPGDPGNVWSGNVWDDGPNVGQLLT